jgi:hypothetical protein
VPVTVTLEVPEGVVDEVVIVIVVVPEPVTVVGLKEAEAPDGNPVAVKLTVWLKPLRGLIVIVLVVLPPAAVEPLVGLAAIVKSGETTFSVTDVVFVVLPFTPLIVTV